MPNIKSAKKRVKVLNKKRTENNSIKSALSTSIKKFKVLVSSNLEDAKKELSKVVSLIDSAESKGVIHKNSAARKVARLNALLNKALLQQKPAEAPTTEATEA